ncbi:MAG: ABC transporter permease [Alphaproteobacteria bacterium]|nr:ABC transporter permease [Alphaproteobacteria bacterium]
MVSLARQSLLYDWRRFVAAILTLAFSGLLMLIQVGLLLGQLDSFTLPIRRARADLWVTAPNVSSWEQSTIVAARNEGRFWAHPAVLDVQEMGLGQGEWRTGDGKRQSVMVIGVGVQQGSLSEMEGFAPETLAILARPDTVVIDRTDAEKLGARVGSTAEISGIKVTIGGFVRSFRSNVMPLVFASQATLRHLNQDWSGYGPPYFLLKLDPQFDRESVRDDLKSNGGTQAYDIAEPNELIFRSAQFWLEESGSGTSFAFSMLLAMFVGIGVTSQTLRGAITASLKEYAALRALGIEVARLRGIVLEQSLWVALAGIVLMAVAAAALAALAWTAGIPLSLPWWISLPTALFVALIAGMSGLLSLSVLYRSEPADLLR